MKEVPNILKILEGAKVAIKEGDSLKLKHLSDQTNNTVSRTHDPDNIAVAVIVYSLGKIIERRQYSELSGWGRFYKNVMVYLDKAIKSLKKGDEVNTQIALGSIRKEIDNLSGKLKKYIRDVFHKAKINKASKIYEHGISLEKTAKLLGLTMYEVAAYSGQAHIHDEKIGKGPSATQRIKLAMGLFV